MNIRPRNLIPAALFTLCAGLAWIALNRSDNAVLGPGKVEAKVHFPSHMEPVPSAEEFCCELDNSRGVWEGRWSYATKPEQFVLQVAIWKDGKPSFNYVPVGREQWLTVAIGTELK